MPCTNRSAKPVSLAGLVLATLLISACAGTADRYAGDTPHSQQATPSPGDRPAVNLAVATRMLGKPYRYGGASPSGFDCSGLVYYTYRQSGIEVPRTTTDQYRQSEAITRKQLLPGDLVFFRLNSRKVSHVGIYAGDGQFIHAPSSGKRVSYADLGDTFWRVHTAGFRRFY